MKRKKIRSFLRCCLFIVVGTLTSLESSADLYVSNTTGNDSNPGTQALPLRSLRKAAQLATSGTVVRILTPGPYYTMNMDPLMRPTEAPNLETWCYDCPPSP